MRGGMKLSVRRRRVDEHGIGMIGVGVMMLIAALMALYDVDNFDLSLGMKSHLDNSHVSA